MPHGQKPGMSGFAQSSTAPEQPEFSAFLAADNWHPVPLSSANLRRAHHTEPWPKAGTARLLVSDRRQDSAAIWSLTLPIRPTNPVSRQAGVVQARTDSACRPEYEE